MAFKYYDESMQHPTESKDFANICNAKRLVVMSPAKKNVRQNENLEYRETFFVGIFQIFLDKTATTTKRSALTAYLVHALLLKFMTQFRLDDGWY